MLKSSEPQEAGEFLPDFCAIFHSVDPRLASFTDVTSVTRQDAAPVSDMPR
jgi:hypothetical protein